MSTTAPEVDERAHRDALVELLPHEDVFDVGMVSGVDGNPGKTPSIHWMLQIERRYVEPRRAGRVGRSGWRVAVIHVGRTPDEARWAQNEATNAYDEARIEVGAETSTPLSLESARGIERDKHGWFSGASVYTYAL